MCYLLQERETGTCQLISTLTSTICFLSMLTHFIWSLRNIYIFLIELNVSDLNYRALRLNCVTWTLEKGSMTLMRFCSSRLSYSLVRWVLMMGSSLSSALYSVSALGRKRKHILITN